MNAQPLLDFDALVELHYQPLFRFAMKLCGQMEAALDLTQHTFCNAAGRGHQLREPAKAKQWLFTSLFRHFLQARRREMRFPHARIDDVQEELPAVSPRAAILADERQVLAALGELKEQYRQPLTLYYLHELSYKEISRKLGIPSGTVMSRISRGRQLLREALEPAAGASSRVAGKLLSRAHPPLQAHSTPLS